MSDEIQEALDQLSSAIAAADADAVEDSIRQLEFFIVEDGAWRATLFDGIKPLWRDRRFLAIPSSVRLARLVAENWDALTPAQRGELRPLLTDAFEHFADWLGAFVLAEVYGERYADEEAFATLDRLSASASTTPARALATYGLGRLARTVRNGPLYARAIARLTALADSVTPDVRSEARSALDKIGR
jgi:hypothetical protein